MPSPLIRIFGWPAIKLQGDVLFAERLNWLQRHIRRGVARTLDAGCGRGAMSMLAAKLGNSTVGLTFDAADARTAFERAKAIRSGECRFNVVDLRELKRHVNQLGFFDQIIACEVLEHLIDDQLLLNNLSSMLKPGGQIFITTPYLHHHAVFGEKVSPTEDGGHVRFGYTHAQLDAMLRISGLEVVSRGFLNGYFAQRCFSTYLRLSRISPKMAWLLTLPFRPLRTFDGFIGWLTKYPYMSLTSIARKPAETSPTISSPRRN